MSFPGTIYHKNCQQASCRASHWYGFSILNEQIYPDVDRDKSKFWISTNKTVFSVNLLKRVTTEITVGKCGFSTVSEMGT